MYYLLKCLIINIHISYMLEKVASLANTKVKS